MRATFGSLYALFAHKAPILRRCAFVAALAALTPSGCGDGEGSTTNTPTTTATSTTTLPPAQVTTLPRNNASGKGAGAVGPYATAEENKRAIEQTTGAVLVNSDPRDACQ